MSFNAYDPLALIVAIPALAHAFEFTELMMLTKKDKALTQAMVRLPLLPHPSVVDGLNKWVQGFTGDKSVKVYDEDPLFTLHSYISDRKLTQAEKIIKTSDMRRSCRSASR